MNLLIKLLDALAPYGTYSYFFIFGLLIACGFGFPMPEDIILVTGGVLASRGIIDFWLTVVLCMFGVLGGDGTIFLLGKYFGPRIKTKKFFQWVMPPSRDEMVSRNIKKYGDKVIFMARFMPGLRTPIFFATGTYQIPFWKFLLFDGVAALVSVPLWIYVGLLFGQNLENLERAIRKAQWGIYLALGALLVIIISLILIKRRYRSKTVSES